MSDSSLLWTKSHTIPLRPVPDALPQPASELTVPLQAQLPYKGLHSTKVASRWPAVTGETIQARQTMTYNHPMFGTRTVDLYTDTGAMDEGHFSKRKIAPKTKIISEINPDGWKMKYVLDTPLSEHDKQWFNETDGGFIERILQFLRNPCVGSEG